MWKESRYNVYLPFSSEDTLVINTFRRSIIQIPSSLISYIRQRNSTNNDVYGLDLSILREAGIIVPIDTNEERMFHEWYERIVSNYSHIRSTIALTSACNLNCAYCFETGSLRKKTRTMSTETATQAVQWLTQFSQHVNSESVFIVFYGGEPTLAPKRMIQIIESCRQQMGANSKIFFGMYSNGVVFNQELNNIFSQPDFQWAQITLDGPREVHDKRRIQKSGQGTFDQIWKNIDLLVNSFEVFVRVVVNFDKTNYKFIPQLLEKIAKSNWKSGMEVAFNPIFDTGLNKDYCSAHNFPEHESYELWRELYEEALNLGINTPFLRMLDKGPCAIHRAGNFYIAPDGAICECIGLLGVEQFLTGNVNESFSASNLSKREKWIRNNTEWPEKCNNCGYLPICLGGCRFKAFCETADLKGWMCHKDLIETCELKLVCLSNKIENKINFT